VFLFSRGWACDTVSYRRTVVVIVVHTPSSRRHLQTITMSTSEEHRETKRTRVNRDSEEDEQPVTDEHQLIAQLQAQLRASKAAVRASKAAVRASQARLRASEEKYSVFDLLKAMPSMAVNKNCPPSITDNGKARAAVTKYRAEMLRWKSLSEENKSEKPTRLNYHEPAKITLEAIPEACLNFDVHLKDGNDQLIKSVLAVAELSNSCRVTLEHHNKTSPRDYVSMAIKDVIHCCGLHATVIKEATLFSLRPNLIMVVYEDRVLFTVEIKSPSKEGDVFNAETAAGQTLDYLKGLKQYGIDQPFALLSTYNESVIVRCNADRDTYAEHLSAGAHNAKQLPGKRHQQKGDVAEPKHPPASPPKAEFSRLRLPSLSTRNINQTTKPSEEANADVVEDPVSVDDFDDAMQRSGYDYIGREVIISQKFGVNDLYKALTLLLESSLVSSKASKESVKTFVPEDGAGLNCELCSLSEDSFSWQRVSISHVSYSIPPRFQNDQIFHVLCVLGQGGTGRTVLCCTSTGEMFTTKLFLEDISTQYSGEDDRMRDLESQIKSKMDLAEKEANLWLELAPEGCHKYCKAMKMNNIPAITMPFFPPIHFEQREEALKLIEARLTEFARKGYVYSGEDLGWRHFGCRWSESTEMEITLLDLGSLEEGQSYSEVLIESQMNELKKRMGEDPVAAPSIVIT
jgi:hypothetical protein